MKLPPCNNGDLIHTAVASSRPGSNDRQTAAPEQENKIRGETRPLALLLDLSRNNRAAQEWASSILPAAHVETLNKADLKRISKRDALAKARAMKPADFLVFTSDLTNQSGLGAFMLFGVLAGAGRVRIGDREGRTIWRSWLGIWFLEAPRLALELLIGYGFLLPLSWLITEALSVSLAFRGAVRASRMPKRGQRALNVLYIRATLSTATEGGMQSHVAGFAGGARAMGHRLKFLVSGARLGGGEAHRIPPSLMFSVNKTLFELWNNLVFTSQSYRSIVRAAQVNEFDCIYQRYSRFNWTGVALSLLTGLPLLLEYNGSEVWIGRRWDPIGQLWLLKRFERLNRRAADLIFVVSEVERRNLIESGLDSMKIVVNPNGVDVDRFRPGCGGGEIRRALGIEEKMVVGFAGTFGPWHGGPVLARAAAQVDSPAGYHFLFIGDGDERAETQSIIEAAGVSASFIGRVSHDKVPSYLDSCDVLVSPHVFPNDGGEFFGSPTKLFEYMAMARPIIASRLGQIADVIVDGENGLLVEPGDVPALARALERLAGDDDLRARLGTNARTTVAEFYTWEQNAARVFQHFERRLEDPSARFRL